MRPALRNIAVAGLLVPVLAGCQSTKDKAAELEAKIGPARSESETSLKISAQSKSVKVVDSTILTDVNGSAVVLLLRNESKDTLTDVPILIDVRNAKGKSVFRNDNPGVERALASMPLLEPGEEAYWVHDQVLAFGKPETVKPVVGEVPPAEQVDPPEIEVSDPELKGDPVSGLEASGTVINRTGREQRSLLLYAVARKGDEIVAAGRGEIDRLKPETKPVPYSIFFIGNPEGADVTVTSFPPIEK